MVVNREYGGLGFQFYVEIDTLVYAQATDVGAHSQFLCKIDSRAREPRVRALVSRGQFLCKIDCCSTSVVYAQECESIST